MFNYFPLKHIMGNTISVVISSKNGVDVVHVYE